MTLAGLDDDLHLIDLLDRLLAGGVVLTGDVTISRRDPGRSMTGLPSRIDAEPETVARDLGRLVLTIVGPPPQPLC